MKGKEYAKVFWRFLSLFNLLKLKRNPDPMKESKFQSDTIKEIERRFPGAIVTKMDANYIQGIPDILVLYQNRWATLEFKKSEKASHQPNQDYYVNQMNNMSFSAFIFPENKEEVLDEMERSFKT